MVDEKTRMEYLRRMQEGMRAMTDAEIAEMQMRQAPGMINADQFRGQAGMQNFWRTNEGHWIPEAAKPTFWQRLKRMFLRPNAKNQGDSGGFIAGGSTGLPG